MIRDIVERQREFFRSGKTLPVEYRIRTLKALRDAIVTMEPEIEAALKIYGSSLDSNSLNALDTVESIMPQVMFFSNLVYCFLYGTVLSAVLSRNIPPRDPFARERAAGDAGRENAG